MRLSFGIMHLLTWVYKELSVHDSSFFGDQAFTLNIVFLLVHVWMYLVYRYITYIVSSVYFFFAFQNQQQVSFLNNVSSQP